MLMMYGFIGLFATTNAVMILHYLKEFGFDVQDTPLPFFHPVKILGNVSALAAFIGIYYARAEGLNTLNQGLRKMVREEMPAYELITGALIGIGAIFLIIPGFATDLVGFLIIFPPTRKLIFKKFSNKNKKNNEKSKDYIEGEYKDLDD